MKLAEENKVLHNRKMIKKNCVREPCYSKKQNKINLDQLLTLFSCMSMKTSVDEVSPSSSCIEGKTENFEYFTSNCEIASRIDHRLLIHDKKEKSLRLTHRNLSHGNICLGLNEHLIVRRNVTLYDYLNFDTLTKFKVCLNITRQMIFKSNSSFLDISDIQNVFFYQVFKKFENFYTVSNNYWNHSNLDLTVAKAFIKKVESVFFEIDLEKPISEEQKTFILSYKIKPQFLDNCQAND